MFDNHQKILEKKENCFKSRRINNFQTRGVGCAIELLSLVVKSEVNSCKIRGEWLHN